MSFPSDDPWSDIPYAIEDDTLSSSADSSGSERRKPRANAATGASAAGVRAVSAQAMTFYFRAPVKAFFRTRVERNGQVLAKAINPQVAEGGWSWRTTTPGLLAHAVRMYGWRFIPDQVLPPLLANVGVGAVLYTSYLQVLASIHGPTLQANKRIYPPPAPELTFTAGFTAGALQSVVAAPLDALQARLRTSDLLEAGAEAEAAGGGAAGPYRSVWQYSRDKLREIGLRGVFSGWGLSFLKDSFGSGLFFCLFEAVKAQGFYAFVRHYYGSLQPQRVEKLSVSNSNSNSMRDGEEDQVPAIRPHYALEPCFLMLGGITATVGQQLVLHPLGHVQAVFYKRLEYVDERQRQQQQQQQMMARRQPPWEAYRETLRRCGRQAARLGGWRAWLFRGFWGRTVRQVPSTSAGLVIFELVRRKYGAEAEAVHIREDGYEIVLT